jgi:para-aminobenzoate synthetase component 1
MREKMAARTQFAYALPGKDPLRYAAALHTLPYTLFFDSADRAHPQARYSFIAFLPFETIESKGSRVTVTNKDQQLSFIGDPFHIVQQRLDIWKEAGVLNDLGLPDLPPFQGGAAGCFGYDLARQVERLPSKAQDDKSMPDMMVGLYDQVLAFDHQKNRAWFITHADTEDRAKARFHHLRKLTDVAPEIQPQSAEADFAPELMRHEYESRIARVIDYVHAGDIFQANLSQRFVADMPRGFDAYAHYLHLRAVSPAPFAAYMNFGAIKLASASPERFLKLENWQVETRPIKGTAPRHADPEQDARAAQKLQDSEKDRAENAMIVDLLRNDLSKVCQDHSVDVPVLCGLESFAQVHHLVSVVKGMLNAGRTPLDLLRACFPGGSVSGAPKVRAMEIIEELEDNRRGPYCGALGYIGVGGAMDTNIVIRTLVHNGSRTCFNVGGGIVADSNPAAEYEETLAKAKGLLKSFIPLSPTQENEPTNRRVACSG